MRRRAKDSFKWPERRRYEGYVNVKRDKYNRKKKIYKVFINDPYLNEIKP